jgi:predicted NBD/HSP70 family sugar kinase
MGGFVIGIDVGGTNMTLAASGLAGRRLSNEVAASRRWRFQVRPGRRREDL